MGEGAGATTEPPASHRGPAARPGRAPRAGARPSTPPGCPPTPSGPPATSPSPTWPGWWPGRPPWSSPPGTRGSGCRPWRRWPAGPRWSRPTCRPCGRSWATRPSWSPPGDPAALAGALARVLEDPGGEAARAARRTRAAGFTWENCAQATLARLPPGAGVAPVTATPPGREPAAAPGERRPGLGGPRVGVVAEQLLRPVPGGVGRYVRALATHLPVEAAVDRGAVEFLVARHPPGPAGRGPGCRSGLDPAPGLAGPAGHQDLGDPAPARRCPPACSTGSTWSTRPAPPCPRQGAGRWSRPSTTWPSGTTRRPIRRPGAATTSGRPGSWPTRRPGCWSPRRPPPATWPSCTASTGAG